MMITEQIGRTSSQIQPEQKYTRIGDKKILLFDLWPTKYEVNYPIAVNIRRLPAHIKNLANITVNAIELVRADEEKINIIVTGSSGLIIGTLLWQELTTRGRDVLMTHIRKDVTGHHGSMFESLVPHDKWHETFNIIVDDFVATGATLRRIIDALAFKVEFLDGILIDNVNLHKLNFDNMKRLSFIAS
jgi:orotate phosphoribosyltransferase-like protein